MNLFSQLLEELADEKRNTLTACLLKAKLLASKLKSSKLKEWVAAELDGYPEQTDPPSYRVIRPVLMGDFWGPFGGRVQNVRLMTSGLSEVSDKIRQEVENYYFTDNVGSLEELLAAETQTFHKPWDQALVEMLRKVSGTRIKGHVLQSVESVFTKARVRGVLNSIRSRLLDFLIELREEYPELEQDDSAASRIPSEEVTRIVDQKIYSNCTFVGGDQRVASREIHIGGDNIVGGDFAIAEAINDSFNKVNAAAHLSELKQKLKELSEALSIWCKQLTAEQAKEAVHDFDTLASEAAKPQPRWRWLKIAGESLIGMATTAGQTAIAASVQFIMNKLLPANHN